VTLGFVATSGVSNPSGGGQGRPVSENPVTAGSMYDFRSLHGLPFATDDMQLIGEGFNTRVFLASDGWVLRAANYDDVLAQLTHERDILRYLSRLSLETPRDFEVIDPCSALPHGGSYHRFIAGRTCMTLSENQQRQLGRVLLEIHDSLPRGGIPRISDVSEHLDAFAEHLTESEVALVSESFEDQAAEDSVVRFVHGDVWPENLIERESDLVGLLDWARCGLGDIAVDFAGLAYLPNGVMAGVLRAYVDAGGKLGGRFAQRLQLARLNRELLGLHHAIVHPESGELADCLRKVRGVVSQIISLETGQIFSDCVAGEPTGQTD